MTIDTTLPVPVSVNYFPSRRCNYRCLYCFHTETSRFMLSLAEAQRGLAFLAQAGMRKLNFSGGEPLLHRDDFIGPLIRFSKESLRLECVSVVCNGTRVTREWLQDQAPFLDMLAVSCDSFDAATNSALGRGRGEIVGRLWHIREWCAECGIRFKVNTVVNKLNLAEDMNKPIASLNPYRWKCFQLLVLHAENAGPGSLRKASALAVTSAQFWEFVTRHQSQRCLIPEDNRLMRDSYINLDERMRFLDCRGNRKKPTASILDVGVAPALAESGFDRGTFRERGGEYDWTRGYPGRHKQAAL